ncbi:MAG: protein phosphatase 2C domain-containing protein [Myxococcota bacterium]
MTILFSARTDVGRVREQNEDNFLVDRKLQLYVVCDGMGGHLSGEVASATAVNVVRETLLQHRELVAAYEKGVGAVDEDDIGALLTQAVQHASNRIYERGMMNPEQRGMGTTLTLLLIARDRGFVAHVGDSRIYRWRGGDAEQITEDHSLANAMKNTGASAEEMAVAGRLKNAVTRAVGVQESVEVDTFSVALEPGDLFLLCSDGLHGYFDEDDSALERFVSADDLQGSVDGLVSWANDCGGKDNITALMVHVTGDRPSSHARAPEDLDAVLRDSYVARDLTERERAVLLGHLHAEALQAGATLAGPGSPGDDIVVVASGRLHVSSGKDATRVLERGDVLGDVTSLAGTPHPVTVRADDEESTRILRLPREALGALAEEEPSLLTRLLLNLSRGLARRLATATDALGDPVWRYGAVRDPVPTRDRTGERKATTTVDLDPHEIMEARADERAAPATEVPPPVPPAAPATAEDEDEELGVDVGVDDTLPGVTLTDEGDDGPAGGPRANPTTDPGSHAS